MKKLMNLKEVKKMSKNQQRSINGGRMKCYVNGSCISFGPQCAELICVFGEFGSSC